MKNTPKPTTLAELFDNSTSRFASLFVSSFVDGANAYTFASFREKTLEISALLSRYGVGAGDRVVILSENRPEWTISMFAATAFGRVMVPVLQDCSANEVTNIIRHSESKAALVSSRQKSKISEECWNSLSLIISIDSWEILKNDETAEEAATKAPSPDDLAAILYTSGTSGNAKGVMLSHRNICHNLVSAPGIYVSTPEHVWLSFLPMAHTYELSLSVLYPFHCGSRVYYLKKAPTPSALMDAFEKVHPNIICSVPLIIEKIYRRVVLPTIRHNKVLSWLHERFPSLVYRIVGLKLKKTFGGRLQAFAIGGAKLDEEVENFLEKSRFPYAIGYGLTETAPLVCATPVGQTRVGTTGTAVKGVEVKVINPDPQTGIGELVVKGPNVMMGYYKDPERTREAFTEDGWFRTKDLAFIDKDGVVSIKGRLGNMILSSSGENVYPEEIEMVINGYDGVEESLVKGITGKLVALVKLNDGLVGTEQMAADIVSYVNASVSKSSHIAAVEFVAEPFEKTATRKIRRFKYQ